MDTNTSEGMFACYEALSARTGEMVVAAQTGNWEVVSALEGECASLVALLRANEYSIPLNPAERERKRLLLTKILQDDGRSAPWCIRGSNACSSACN